MACCAILHAILDIKVWLLFAGLTVLLVLLIMVRFAGNMELMDGELDMLYGTEGNVREGTEDA